MVIGCHFRFGGHQLVSMFVLYMVISKARHSTKETMWSVDLQTTQSEYGTSSVGPAIKFYARTRLTVCVLIYVIGFMRSSVLCNVTYDVIKMHVTGAHVICINKSRA